jgi:hypothetical protein
MIAEYSGTGLKKGPKGRGRGRARRSIDLIEAMYDAAEAAQPITGRGVGYKLFAPRLIPSMGRNPMQRVYRLLKEAREEGTIPWEWIVDETREREIVPTWDDPINFGIAITRQYRKNKWAGQPVRIEVWSEKSTVRGTLAPVLNAYEVGFVSVHGYSSATAIQNLVVERFRDPKPLLVLYVGDWDPSGLHMSEIDLPARAEGYSRREHQSRDDLPWEMTPLTIERIALSAEDVADPDLPSFAAETKRQDSRYSWFVEHYGNQCWELDALSPVVLRQRVEAEIGREIDVEVWNRYVEAEQLELESITDTVRAWNRLSQKPEGEW